MLGVLVFQVPFAPTSWALLLLVFLLTMLALYGLGMVFASVFLRWGRQALHVVSLLQEPVYLLSGLNFPVRTLGGGVATAAPPEVVQGGAATAAPVEVVQQVVTGS